ncbi:hypothetical protein BKA93DRAFT_827890 [Sparassis latifolia]
MSINSLQLPPFRDPYHNATYVTPSFITLSISINPSSYSSSTANATNVSPTFAIPSTSPLPPSSVTGSSSNFPMPSVSSTTGFSPTSSPSSTADQSFPATGSFLPATGSFVPSTALTASTVDITSLLITDSLVSTTSPVLSSTKTAVPVTTSASPTELPVHRTTPVLVSIGAIVGPVLGGVTVLVMILLAILLRHRYRQRSGRANGYASSERNLLPDADETDGTQMAQEMPSDIDTATTALPIDAPSSPVTREPRNSATSSNLRSSFVPSTNGLPLLDFSTGYDVNLGASAGAKSLRFLATSSARHAATATAIAVAGTPQEELNRNPSLRSAQPSEISVVSDPPPPYTTN